MEDIELFPDAGSLPAPAISEAPEDIELYDEVPETDPGALQLQLLNSIDQHLEHIDEFTSSISEDFFEHAATTLDHISNYGYWIFAILFLTLAYNMLHNFLKSILRRY